MQASPYGIARLSFRTLEDFREFATEHGKEVGQLWRWRARLGDQPDPLSLPGICDICDQQTSFAARPRALNGRGAHTYGVTWWTSAACDCGLPNLERAALRVMMDECNVEGEIYHVGEFSRFRKWLAKRFKHVHSSQYHPDRGPGEIVNSVRYEDITRLSYDSSVFDVVVCMEVLEHIPDYRAALREMSRVLRPQGCALLTFPWLGGKYYEHLVRAEMLADGSIKHHLPPEYHGDPAKSEGILSFRAFGWSVLDDLRQAGFAEARAHFVLGPVHGYFDFVPVIVARNA